MGVSGLTPFLQKTCPQVIQKLTNRLQGLSGKTVVIDGTLITQRFHFAPMPHPYRHVLGWYRLLKELKDNGVNAICVFDGKERSLAKSDEIERRRQVRRVDYARSLIESERLQRLQNLTKVLENYRCLNPSKRQHAFETLKTILSKPQDLDASLAAELESIVLSTGGRDVQQSADDDWLGLFDESEIKQILLEDMDVPSSLQGQPAWDVEPFQTRNPSHISQRDPEDTSFSSYDQNYQEDISSSLEALYLSYRRSTARLDGLSAPTFSAIRKSVQTDDSSDARAEIAMSKSQHQLTLAEGQFWEGLVKSGLPAEGDDALESRLSTIANKSSVIAESYLRRRNPPSSETYQESKAILHAMGVPCIESTGPFEAEALASSLVLHGLADYVASEDTDVLVYEAALIRNITSRSEPLILVSGTDVRTSLNLDRASYVDFVLLLGTDFSQRIKNVGPQRALKFIREHGSIEHILEHETQYSPRQPPELYLKQVRLARSVFETLPPLPSPELLQPGEYNDKEVCDVLRRYQLSRFMASDDWDSSAALEGNYFFDNPAAA
ncbi:hypothetical protein HETIRDRAFT_55937 [Heterobasidion irregulare TC 32-1]|uniref:Exonuclease 1 n=1 Tax=Heterobasidion irregulare (strain TC 32-1) TaxID=747525 RepID=W4JYL8_HETIT|nr:uncharacterized protein HETIRDRAFT_55937 [Heterobasidion irregulare TC 32-1]ETW77956.1 hypothetical protein HETIRDRAFT_55937 [Heterobasidion irregulare TC 32-1]